MIRCFRVAEGAQGSVQLDYRKVMANAIAVSASAIVIAHFRPDGDELPSDADYAATNAIQEVCNALDVTLHDYVVVVGDHCASLKKSGYIGWTAMRPPHRR